MALGLLFLLLSVVFSLGWAFGSALGYQNGRHDAEELARLQAALIRGVEQHLEDVKPVQGQFDLLEPPGVPVGASA